ncbi:MAG: hypothetical protein IVW57_01720 [Ktedonobacterales bacterium]|nr:hypothetical protein [Ktedonobacterales bacterium]
MRELNRRRVTAAAKSHHASKDELREARQRLKDIESELRQIELLPETKHGEVRAMRYERVLRLRAMRDEFQSMFPIEQPSRASNALLALVMTVASLALCGFLIGGGYLALNLINQKPDPVNTANSFWDQMKQGNYPTARASFFSPTLREQLPLENFIASAHQADVQFGPITSYVFVKQSGDFNQTGTITYSITRGTRVKYTVTLSMVLFRNAWGISDLNAAVAPTQAGVPAPKPSPTSVPTATSTP